MNQTLKLDLIGIHPQVNSETQESFLNLSFRLTGSRVATMAVNDEATQKAIGARFDAASEAGERLIFEASNCELAVATELAEDGATQIPVVRKGTRYYRVAEADVQTPVSLKLIGTRKKGASVSIEL